ncbi:dihydrofolate reductase family protein [uncultured Roseibium sp.]|uniref:dihydrofolate reductase family protein n=1 Tax=uncultured Roseibium sp. TaxID=1936171 RepID=UPI002609A23E|nr:dihydrofolate reductase family protein [uncultured Roseibium sp.]
MHPIIYDVAVSLDGFISGPGGDISKFAHEGEVVDDYFARLGDYTTAIMGRATYEFGYRFGLKPGQNPYKHMRTIVFSESLQCPEDTEIEIERALTPEGLKTVKETSQGPVYLCGGGSFAGAVLELGLIDRLRLKRSPVVIGSGVRLFAGAESRSSFLCTGTKRYDTGHVLEDYEIRPG